MSRDWTTALFRSGIFTPGAPEAVAAAPAETDFAWRALGLRPGDRVLDVACGTGRHAVRLARRGALVLGVDASAAYLREARRAARGLPGVRFVRGDMRRLHACGEFDAAVNLWTSFGYFRRPADDLRVLRGIARALKPGGRLLIDVSNFDWVRARAPSRWWTRASDGSYLLQESRVLGGKDPRTVNDWTRLAPGGRARRTRFTLRGYGRARLFALLRKAGLRPARVWGGLDGAQGASRPAEAPRLVVLALNGGGGAASR
ncbi:MAG: class I SAM-dependent methyltransferase [Elusimicrobia bacterium]|nr:class I SAM-dependent methyltransferase [Elusimicrobiota bacterium]